MTNPSSLAERTYGCTIPYDPVYKNLALLQAAHGSEDMLRVGDEVSADREAMVRTLQQVPPEFFGAHPWPAIAAHVGFKGHVLAEGDAAELSVLNLLRYQKDDGILVNDQLPGLVSRTVMNVMRRARSQNEQLFFGAGINVLETTMTTGLTRVLAQREDKGTLGVITEEKDAEQYGNTIRQSLRVLAKKMGCEEMIFSE